MYVDEMLREKAFYHESEWRYVPKHSQVIDHLNFETHSDADHLADHNYKTKQNCMLKFEAEDIKYIFVKDDSFIPGIVDFIGSKLIDFSEENKKILYTRIISLESLGKDI